MGIAPDSVNNLPVLALSVRQPWAWAIIYAGKDIENRSWQAVNHGLSQRGRVAIHAAKSMSRREYEDAAEFMASIKVVCPPAAELKRGGIIGRVDIVDVVTDSDSDWFFGPRGLVLRDPRPCDFIPCMGALGYFAWARMGLGTVPLPSKWMLPNSAPLAATQEALKL
jgi:hypothetical protein